MSCGDFLLKSKDTILIQLTEEPIDAILIESLRFQWCRFYFSKPVQLGMVRFKFFYCGDFLFKPRKSIQGEPINFGARFQYLLESTANGEVKMFLL